MPAFFKRLVAILSIRWVFWLILAIPAIKLVWPIAATGSIPGSFSDQSGEWAIRFLLVTLALTPLQRLFRKSRFVYWFTRRRRYFGVASFCYAGLHVGVYVFETFRDWGEGALTWILFTATNLYAWSAWLAFFILIPLALTSNGFSLKTMGRWWKWVQRLTYLAAVAAAVHWVLLDGHVSTYVQLGVLVVLEALRLALPFWRRWRGGDRPARLG